jgi:DNA polymerase I-like protein with 3'-5' exonuclease and polymerase domains
MVGAVRWRGYAIDRDGIEELRKAAISRQINIPKSPNLVRAWITEHLDETEILALKDPKTGKPSTKKVLLEEISEWQNEDGTPHRAAVRAKSVLDARKAAKEVELYDKLLRANRFHASFIVIGTRSSRMAGTDQFNAQGIKHTFEVRSKFPLADGDFILCGGDFDAFEVSIADAAYSDPVLRADLESGKKVHGLFAMSLFPDKTYEEIMASKGTEDDMYDKGKRGVFAILYGGNENTLKDRLGIPIEHAEQAFRHFTTKYKGVGIARQRIDRMFCSMRQPKGIGTKVEWHEPSEYIESLIGFRRYFTLENKVAKVLFDLANKLPESWKKIPVHVTRRAERGRQTGAGAIMSALYAAAFNIQASNMRAGANHEIQSTGAGITKNVQRRIWDLQPAGIWNWKVQPMNIHDEIMAPCLPEMAEPIEQAVREGVEAYRDIVPLIGITWERNMKSWAEK